MHRQLIAFCAAATTLAIPAFAQTQRAPVSSDKDIALTGCVQKNKSGGYWLTNATIGDEHSGGSSSTSTTTGTTGTTAATTTSDNDLRSATNNRMWNLGTQKDVEKYLNQKVQVIGHAKNDTSGDQLKGTHGGEMQARDFDVKSIRLISSSCS